MEYLFYHKPPTPNKIKKANKTQQISVTTHAFFVKTELQHIQLSFYITFDDVFSEMIKPWKN